MLRIYPDMDYNDYCEFSDAVVTHGWNIAGYTVEDCFEKTTFYIENKITLDVWYLCTEHKELLKANGLAQ